jgi:hypothetical protein
VTDTKACDHCTRIFTRRDPYRRSPAAWAKARFCSRECYAAGSTRSPRERFEDHYVPEPTSGCHLWISSVDDTGYGWFNDGEKTVKAHRFAYVKAHGPIPDDLNVLHRCDVRCYVNEEHLFLGTQADNLKDCQMKGRTARGARSSSAKLTEEIVALGRALGMGPTAFARRFGVDVPTAHRALTGRTWRHVPMPDRNRQPSARIVCEEAA